MTATPTVPVPVPVPVVRNATSVVTSATSLATAARAAVMAATAVALHTVAEATVVVNRPAILAVDMVIWLVTVLKVKSATAVRFFLSSLIFIPTFVVPIPILVTNPFSRRRGWPRLP